MTAESREQFKQHVEKVRESTLRLIYMMVGAGFVVISVMYGIFFPLVKLH
jgi:hypothetical protein